MSNEPSLPSASVSEPAAGPEQHATRAKLLELAAEVFAQEGYGAVSLRDLARRSSLTTGAIYAHFLNKAELLVEAIDARVMHDVDTSRDRTDLTFEVYLTDLNRRFVERADLRALLLEGAVAARNDPAVRERLTAEQGERFESWVAEYEAAQSRGDLDGDVDMRAFVLMLWSIELGLGVVEALGLDHPDPEAWADLTGRLVRSVRTS